LEKLAQLHGVSYAMMYTMGKEDILRKYPFLHEWKKDTQGPWRNVMLIWNHNLKMCVKLLEVCTQIYKSYICRNILNEPTEQDKLHLRGKQYFNFFRTLP